MVYYPHIVMIINLPYIMRKLLLLFFVLVTVFSSNAFSQDDVVEWNFYAQPLNGNEFILNYKAEIKEGWYIYSTRPNDINRPTEIEFKDYSKIVRKGTDVIEYGNLIEQEDTDLETTFYKYANEVTFQVPVEALENNLNVEGKIVFQLCDDNVCLPIDSEKFRFKLKQYSNDILSSSSESENVKDKNKNIVQLDHPIDKPVVTTSPSVVKKDPIKTVSQSSTKSKVIARGITTTPIDPQSKSKPAISNGYSIIKSNTYTDKINQDRSGEIIVIPSPAPRDVRSVQKNEKPTSQVINFYDPSKPTKLNIDKTVDLDETDALVIGNIKAKSKKESKNRTIKKVSSSSSRTMTTPKSDKLDNLLNIFNSELADLPTDEKQIEENSKPTVIETTEQPVEEETTTLIALNETEEAEEEEETTDQTAEEEEAIPVAPMIVPENPVAWSYTKEVLEDGNVKLIFEANIEDGWHLYSASNQGNAPSGLLINLDNQASHVSTKVEGELLETVDPVFMKETGKYVGKVVFEKTIKWNQGEALNGTIQYMCGGTDKYTQLQKANFAFDAAQATPAPTEEVTSQSGLNNWWWIIGLTIGLGLLLLARFFTPQIMTKE